MSWQSLDAVLRRMSDEEVEARAPVRDRRLMQVKADYDPEPEELDGVRPPRSRYPERDAEIRRLHQEGATGAELADQFDLSHQRISQIVREV